MDCLLNTYPTISKLLADGCFPLGHDKQWKPNPQNPPFGKGVGDNEQQKINRSIAQLEFHFYDAFFKITQKQKPTLAVLTSHGTSAAIKIADFMPVYNHTTSWPHSILKRWKTNQKKPSKT